MAFTNSKAFKMFAMAIVLAVMSSEMVGAIIHDGTPSFKLGLYIERLASYLDILFYFCVVPKIKKVLVLTSKNIILF